MSEPFHSQQSTSSHVRSVGIPLVRAVQLEPFVAAAERLGIRTERYLDQVRLSGSVLERPQEMIARRQVWGFANQIEREQGLTNYGLEAATTDPIATLGAFGRQLATEPTLWMALARLAREFGRHSTHACLRLEESSEGIRLIRHDQHVDAHSEA